MYGRLNVNVALNRPTFASSVAINSYGTHAASRAVDGNNDTDAVKVDNSCFASGTEINPWWAVDLGAAVAVAAVLFTNRGDIYNHGSRIRIILILFIVKTVRF